MNPGTVAHQPVGGLDLWNYLLLIGFFVALAWGIMARPKNFPVGRWGLLACGLLLGYCGFFGAKFLFVWLHWHQEILSGKFGFYSALRRAGYGFLGTLGFELIGLVIFTKCRARRLSLLQIGDYIIPFMFLTQAFVRIGCFLAGCCYGCPTDLPWAVVFSNVDAVPRHPTQIYSSIALFLNFFIMRYGYKKGWPTGTVFWGSLCMYGFLRFLIEFLRVDSVEIVAGLTLGNITLLTVCVVSAVMLVVLFFIRRKNAKGI
jgi:phosphatidylglycerol---prolipoprotein diacylglyceryl transferase